jgi:serine/threonine-protein kinase
MTAKTVSEDNLHCTNCGWVDKGVHLASYLYPKTFLAGRYIVGKLISYNGESALYVGYDTLTEKRVAIKEYMPDALCTRSREVLPLSVNPGELPLYKTYLSEFIELNRSLQSLGSLSGIQRVTDVFSENTTAYAIFEYADGVNLKTYLQNFGGYLSFVQCKELLSPIFAVLGRVNAAGIVHRGISPKTVFVSQVGGRSQLYLSDFAITAARIYGSKINEEIYAGYAAPEQYSSIERHGDWTDVYGISALVYNVLTGIDPPDAQERSEVDTLIEPSVANSQITEKASKAIMSALELSAEARIKTVGEFATALFGRVKTGNTASDTLTAIPVSASFWNTETDPLAPVVPEVEIDFDTEEEPEDEKDAPKFDKSLVEAVEKSLRKEAREKKRKIKMTIAIIGIVLIITGFVILIMLALDGYFDPNNEYNGYGNDITTGAEHTGEPPETTAPQTGPVVIGNEVEVRNFTNLSIPMYNETWAAHLVNENQHLKFRFVPAYSSVHAKNVVFEQRINGQVMTSGLVPVGTEVVLSYSLGREHVRLPAFAGQTAGQFRQSLLGLGVEESNIRVEIDGNETPYSPLYDNYTVIGVVGFSPNDNIRITDFPEIPGPFQVADRVVIRLPATVPPVTEITTTAAVTTTAPPVITTTPATTTAPPIITTPAPTTPYIPETSAEPPPLDEP